MNFVKCNFRWCVNKRKLSKPTLLTYANWANIQPPPLLSAKYCYSKLFAFLLSQEESKNESFGLNSMHVLVPKMLACTSIYSIPAPELELFCQIPSRVITDFPSFQNHLNFTEAYLMSLSSNVKVFLKIQEFGIFRTKWQLLFIVKVM